MPLTVPEVRRLLWRLAAARDAAEATGALRWSSWRRRHQAAARRGHSRRHLTPLPP